MYAIRSYYECVCSPNSLRQQPFLRDQSVITSYSIHYTKLYDPLLLPAVAAEAGVDVVMVDTGIKDGKSTFEFMDEKELKEFTDLAHEHGLENAIAGSLKFEDLPVLERIGPDISYNFV